MLAFAVSVVGMMCSLLYTSDVGYFLLDVVDHYTNNLLVVSVGFMHRVAAAWVYRLDAVIEEIGNPHGRRAMAIFNASWAVAVVMGNVVGFAAAPPLGPAVGVGIAAAVAGAGTGTALLLASSSSSSSSSSLRRRLLLVILGPSELLRADLNAALSSTSSGALRICLLWSVVLKYATPIALSVVVSSSVNALVRGGGYGGYSLGYQLFGTLVVFVGVSMMILGLLHPDAYQFLWPRHLDDQQMHTPFSASAAPSDDTLTTTTTTTMRIT